MLAAQHAAECLANGNGMWHSRAPDAREAFILSPTFLKDPSGRRFDQSHWWWGVCDSYDRSKPPALRPAMQYHWAPEGRGCHALRHDQPRLPSVNELATSFCRQHANTSILFVGDSIQGQLFTTFAHLMGYVEVVEGFSNPCYAFKYPRGAHEVDVTARLCGGSVTARFLRNEVLLLKGVQGKRSPGRMLCDWAEAARRADFIVLSYSYALVDHPAPKHSQVEQHSNATLVSILARLSGLLGLADDVSATRKIRGPRVVLRGLHSSLYNCSKEVS